MLLFVVWLLWLRGTAPQQNRGIQITRAAAGDHYPGFYCAKGTIVVNQDETQSMFCAYTMDEVGCNLHYLHTEGVAIISKSRQSLTIQSTKTICSANYTPGISRIALQDYPMNVYLPVWNNVTGVKQVRGSLKITGHTTKQVKILAQAVWPGALVKLHITCSDTQGALQSYDPAMCVLMKYTGDSSLPISSAMFIPTTSPPFVLTTPTTALTATSSTVLVGMLTDEQETLIIGILTAVCAMVVVGVAFMLCYICCCMRTKNKGKRLEVNAPDGLSENDDIILKATEDIEQGIQQGSTRSSEFIMNRGGGKIRKQRMNTFAAFYDDSNPSPVTTNPLLLVESMGDESSQDQTTMNMAQTIEQQATIEEEEYDSNDRSENHTEIKLTTERPVSCNSRIFQRSHPLPSSSNKKLSENSQSEQNRVPKRKISIETDTPGESEERFDGQFSTLRDSVNRNRSVTIKTQRRRSSDRSIPQSDPSIPRSDPSTARTQGSSEFTEVTRESIEFDEMFAFSRDDSPQKNSQHSSKNDSLRENSRQESRKDLSEKISHQNSGNGSLRNFSRQDSKIHSRQDSKNNSRKDSRNDKHSNRDSSHRETIIYFGQEGEFSLKSLASDVTLRRPQTWLLNHEDQLSPVNATVNSSRKDSSKSQGRSQYSSSTPVINNGENDLFLSPALTHKTLSRQTHVDVQRSDSINIYPVNQSSDARSKSNPNPRSSSFMDGIPLTSYNNRHRQLTNNSNEEQDDPDYENSEIMNFGNENADFSAPCDDSIQSNMNYNITMDNPTNLLSTSYHSAHRDSPPSGSYTGYNRPELVEQESSTLRENISIDVDDLEEISVDDIPASYGSNNLHREGSRTNISPRNSSERISRRYTPLEIPDNNRYVRQMNNGGQANPTFEVDPYEKRRSVKEISSSYNNPKDADDGTQKPFYESHYISPQTNENENFKSPNDHDASYDNIAFVPSVYGSPASQRRHSGNSLREHSISKASPALLRRQRSNSDKGKAPTKPDRKAQHGFGRSLSQKDQVIIRGSRMSPSRRYNSTDQLYNKSTRNNDVEQQNIGDENGEMRREYVSSMRDLFETSTRQTPPTVKRQIHTKTSQEEEQQRYSYDMKVLDTYSRSYLDRSFDPANFKGPPVKVRRTKSRREMLNNLYSARSTQPAPTVDPQQPTNVITNPFVIPHNHDTNESRVPPVQRQTSSLHVSGDRQPSRNSTLKPGHSLQKANPRTDNNFRPASSPAKKTNKRILTSSRRSDFRSFDQEPVVEVVVNTTSEEPNEAARFLQERRKKLRTPEQLTEDGIDESQAYRNAYENLISDKNQEFAKILKHRRNLLRTNEPASERVVNVHKAVFRYNSSANNLQSIF